VTGCTYDSGQVLIGEFIMQTMQSSQIEPPSGTVVRRWSEIEFERLCETGIFGDDDVRWCDGTILNNTAPHEPIRWSLDRYFRLDELGFLNREPVQLIDGEIVVRSPLNPPHQIGVQLVDDAMRAIFTTGYRVRNGAPLIIGTSAPQPDIAVVRGGVRSHAITHPTGLATLIVIEVGDSTLRDDIGPMANLYASGGVTDYWVIDLVHDQLRVFRDPQPDANELHGHRYTNITIQLAGSQISPLALPNSSILIDDVLV